MVSNLCKARHNWHHACPNQFVLGVRDLPVVPVSHNVAGHDFAQTSATDPTLQTIKGSWGVILDTTFINMHEAPPLLFAQGHQGLSVVEDKYSDNYWLISIKARQSRGGSRISLGGGANPPTGAPTYNFYQVFRKTAWNWENFGRGGGGQVVRSAPP